MTTSKLRIEQNRYPIAVTGAALRSVQAAEQHADRVLVALNTAWDAMDAHYCDEETPRDATWMANGWKLLESFLRASGEAQKLTGRYVARYSTSREWPGRRIITFGADPNMYMQHLSGVLYDRLFDAGVPLKKNGIYTEQHWRDAAAMGC